MRNKILLASTALILATSLGTFVHFFQNHENTESIVSSFVPKKTMKFETKYITGVDFIQDELLREVYEDGYNHFGLTVCDYVIDTITVLKWSNNKYDVITNNPSETHRNRLTSNPYVVGKMPEKYNDSNYRNINTPETDWTRPDTYITGSPYIEFSFTRFDDTYYTQASLPPRRYEQGGISGRSSWIKSITYYRPKIFTPEIWEAESTAKREAHARVILDETIAKAIELEPDIEGLRGDIALQIIDSKYMKSDGSVYLNYKPKQWTIRLNAYYLAKSSDSELQALFGHELGHIVHPVDRPWGEMSKDEQRPWQDAAESFAMQVMVQPKFFSYYDYLLGTTCMNRDEAGERMNFLHDLGEKLKKSE